MNEFNGDSIKAFMSYCDKDRELAGRIKTELTSFGIEVFLAHEDIPGGKKWEDMIIEHIKKCDIFIALLTKNFEISPYCNQEVGIAISQEKKILPIQVDTGPCGFIKKFQSSKKLDRDDISSFSFEFVKMLQTDNDMKDKMLKCLVKKFTESWSFVDASKKLDMLLTYNNLSREHLNEIARSSLENEQIMNCFVAPKKLKIIFRENKYKQLLNAENLKGLKKRYGI